MPLFRHSVLAALVATALLPAADPPRPLPKQNFTEVVRADTLPADGTNKGEKEVRFGMVYVPGGEFTMGSPDAEPGREPNEGPRHTVRVGAFWMGKCEVTWDEFDLFRHDPRLPLPSHEKPRAGVPDAVTRPTPSYVDETYDHGRDGHPALSMTHHAAMTYCQWLRQKTGRAYRLPTEAEWEYAARAGKGTAYPFGDDPKALGEFAWFKDNSGDDDHPKGTTHKVGTKKANAFGLHDMLGNVAEWTLDQYDPKGYEARARNRLSVRPVTVPTDRKWSHVVRGGSWADKPDRLRCASRRVSDKSWQKWDPLVPRSVWWLTRMDVVGFRVVLAEDEQKELVGLVPKVVKWSED